MGLRDMSLAVPRHPRHPGVLVVAPVHHMAVPPPLAHPERGTFTPAAQRQEALAEVAGQPLMVHMEMGEPGDEDVLHL